MSSVFSVKIGKEIKEKMEKYKGRVNWAEEVRRFLEETVRKIEASENFEKILSRLEDARWQVPRGFSATCVREDRDSG
ncbi:MAG: CopG family transcriptional regulator [Candidatus Nezhaarchaeota archaeon]|nr:CopG family transcriptional regulator [Candidatus Nezhaarchaeota archaeon]